MTASRIAINKAHYPVTVLGYGQRIGIWTQGCDIKCPGCVSQDTWEQNPEREMPIGSLVEWCRRIAVPGLDGITISGGEPLQQSEALADLLSRLRQWTSTLNQPVDFLCYTGLPYRKLKDSHADILAMLDVIIPEPFVANLTGAPLRGSINQPIVTLTELGAERYGARQADAKRFQFTMDETSIWFIGIPERGDMERLRGLCEARGLRLQGASWLT